MLDIGCGSGQPVASYLIERGVSVVGVDTAPEVLKVCRSRLPEQEWHPDEMRGLDLRRRFQGALLAANGFEERAHVAEDPECFGQTVWLAQAS